METKMEKRIVVWVDEKIFDDIEKHADDMTKKRHEEDLEKKIPPSRRRRAVSLSTAARDLIKRGLANNYD